MCREQLHTLYSEGHVLFIKQICMKSLYTLLFPTCFLRKRTATELFLTKVSLRLYYNSIIYVIMNIHIRKLLLHSSQFEGNHLELDDINYKIYFHFKYDEQYFSIMYFFCDESWSMVHLVFRFLKWISYKLVKSTN